MITQHDKWTLPRESSDGDKLALMRRRLMDEATKGRAVDVLVFSDVVLDKMKHEAFAGIAHNPYVNNRTPFEFWYGWKCAVSRTELGAKFAALMRACPFGFDIIQQQPPQRVLLVLDDLSSQVIEWR